MKKEMRYLVPEDYMADPAVHVFNGRVYIYPSHDWESGIPENDNGDHFNMKDYHVFSTDDVMHGEIKDHGVVLATEDIPWAGRQLWDCDVALKDGKYYMYFPLKDQNDIFRIGVAVSGSPEGPFIPQAHPLRGSYSIDPAILEYGNGVYYFSYSTGDTHRLCYAIGDNPYGPFVYQGVILTPVVGWTTHHAITEYKGKWYLFHHDCVPSNGKTWLRSLKVCELEYDSEGKIITIEGNPE